MQNVNPDLTAHTFCNVRSRFTYGVKCPVWGKTDTELYERMLFNQWEGIRLAVERGLPVKVNTVFVKGRNDDEIVPIAKKALEYGAYIHNILPVIPNHNVRPGEAPSSETVAQMRADCQKYLPQLAACQHCRADIFMHGCKKASSFSSYIK